MNFLFFLFFSGLLTFLELLLRSRGILLPLTGCYIFYLAVVYNWRCGIAAGFLAGAVCDFLTARIFPFSAFTYAGIAVYANILHRRNETETLNSHWLPGFLLPVIIYVPLFLFSGIPLPDFLFMLVPSCFLSAVLLPLMIPVMDSAAAKLALPFYMNKKKNRNELWRN